MVYDNQKYFTITPKIGDVLNLSVENGLASMKLKVVERTECKDCCFYRKAIYSGPSSYKTPDGSYCYNFLGNNQDIWINCGKEYRPDKKDVMLKLIK